MTIRPGDPWGEPVTPPAELTLAASDAEARDLVLAGTRELGLTGGDLARAMGGGSPDRFNGTVVRAPIDLLRVEADGEHTLAVAHVVLRRRWWNGPVTFVMNGQFLGHYDVAPRAHPNDGRADVMEVDERMTVRTRWAARGRARLGAHLPHPQLAVAQATTRTFESARALDVWVDGRRWRRARRVTVTVEPDALTVHA